MEPSPLQRALLNLPCWGVGWGGDDSLTSLMSRGRKGRGGRLLFPCKPVPVDPRSVGSSVAPEGVCPTLISSPFIKEAACIV